MIYLDDNYNVMTGQVVECMECRYFWSYIPAGFIYDDPDGGWRQDAEAPHVAGYCAPCAAAIASANHQDYVNGNWEKRTIEDEMWVWAR